MMRCILPISLFLLSVLFFGPIGAPTVGKEQKEYKFELLDDLDKMIVVMVDGPGPSCQQGQSSAQMPEDWTRLWNEAALKIVVDGAANMLRQFNGSGNLQDPDIIVGDMDVISSETSQFYEGRSGLQIIRVQDEQKTNLDKAMDVIFAKIRAEPSKYEGIILLGPMHRRMDLSMCTFQAMVMHASKFPNIPISAVDCSNFLLMLPAGKTKLKLKSMEYTGKSGLLPIRQHQTKVHTKGFQWNLGSAGGEREAIEYGGKLSCSNQIQSANDLFVDANEPVLFTMELKNPNCVLSH